MNQPAPALTVDALESPARYVRSAMRVRSPAGETWYVYRFSTMPDTYSPSATQPSRRMTLSSVVAKAP